MIRFFCRSCWFKIRAEDDCAGKKVRCPKCGDGNFVPAAGIQPSRKKGSRGRAGRRDRAEDGAADEGALDPGGAVSLDVHEPPAEKAPPKRTKGRRNLETGPPLDLKMPPLDELGVPPAEEGSGPPSARAGGPPAEVREELSKYAKGAGPRRAAPARRERRARREPLPRRRIPAAAIVAAVIGAMLVVAVVLWLTLRDTWERDHHDRIAGLADEAKALMADKDFEAAIHRYQEILDLVGDRDLSEPELVAAVQRARDGLGTAKTELDIQRVANEAARRERDLHERRKRTLLATLAKARSAAAAGQLKPAIDNYQRTIDLIVKSPQGAQELQAVLTQARQEQSSVRTKWQKLTEAKLSDLAANAQVAFDGGKLDEAERHCLSVIQLAGSTEVQTAKTRQVATLARTLLAKVREQKQLEARRKAELREKARLAAERERARRARQTRARWQAFYAAAEQIHREGAAPGAALSTVKTLETALVTARAELTDPGAGARMRGLRKSAEQVFLSMRSYAAAREDLGPAATSAPSGAKDDPVLKAKRARVKLCRTKLKRDIEVFVGNYVEFLEATGASVEFVPADLLQAARAARESRGRCKWCKDSGFMPCPHCLVKGLPTGKAKCAKCAGKGLLQCATCTGAGSSLCTRCKGKGKLWAGKRRVSRNQWRDIYRPCSQCNGTGHTHPVGGRLRPGRCPSCGTNSPKGTVPCRHCSRSGRYGLCTTCKGAKKAPCTHCNAHKKLPPTSNPAP